MNNALSAEEDGSDLEFEELDRGAESEAMKEDEDETESESEAVSQEERVHFECS